MSSYHFYKHPQPQKTAPGSPLTDQPSLDLTPRYPTAPLHMNVGTHVTNNNPLAQSPRFSTLESADTPLSNTAAAATQMRDMANAAAVPDLTPPSPARPPSGGNALIDAATAAAANDDSSPRLWGSQSSPAAGGGSEAVLATLPIQAGGPTMDQLLAMDGIGTNRSAMVTEEEEEAEGAEDVGGGAEGALAEDFLAAAAAAAPPEDPVWLLPASCRLFEDARVPSGV